MHSARCSLRGVPGRALRLRGVCRFGSKKLTGVSKNLTKTLVKV